jgi:hypothetical protein
MSNRRNTPAKRRKPLQPYLRLPAFLPVPLRARRDGWTPQRQARFIGLLAQTGCVRTAAHGVWLIRAGVYRLRRPQDGSFSAAAAITRTGRGTSGRCQLSVNFRLPASPSHPLSATRWPVHSRVTEVST